MKTTEQLRAEQEQLGNYNPEATKEDVEARDEPIVFIVHDDLRRDFNRAKKFGELKAIISGRYDNRYTESAAVVGHIRDSLSDYQPGDYLLMVGEPLLAGLVIAVAHEKYPEEPLNVLRYDKVQYKYFPVEINFH